jgi:hypothetical protein
MKKHLVSLAAIAVLAAVAPAQAQFNLKNPLGGSASGQSVDTDAVKKSVSAALADLAEANSRYASALGKESESAQLKEIAAGIKNGSLGVDSKVIGTIKDLSASSVAAMKAKQEAKEKVSADAKKLLVEGLAFHVSGTVAGVNGTKKLKSALESKSPAAMASLASLKDFPGLFGQWTSATGNMLAYMSFNGIDTAKADKDLKAAMADS